LHLLSPCCKGSAPKPSPPKSTTDKAHLIRISVLFHLLRSDITHALLRPLTAKKEKKTKGETPYVIEQRKKAELAAKRAAAIEAARGASKDEQGGAKEQGGGVSNLSGRRKTKRDENSERLIFDIGSSGGGGGGSSSSSTLKTPNDMNAVVANAIVKYKQVRAMQLLHSR
jgi:hypothetical protein